MNYEKLRETKTFKKKGVLGRWELPCITCVDGAIIAITGLYSDMFEF